MLTKKSVEGIQLEGGTMLGTSRGGADLRQGGHAPVHTAGGMLFAGQAGAVLGCALPRLLGADPFTLRRLKAPGMLFPALHRSFADSDPLSTPCPPGRPAGRL